VSSEIKEEPPTQQQSQTAQDENKMLDDLLDDLMKDEEGEDGDEDEEL
jgi:hypothetical protein